MSRQFTGNIHRRSPPRIPYSL